MSKHKQVANYEEVTMPDDDETFQILENIEVNTSDGNDSIDSDNASDVEESSNWNENHSIPYSLPNIPKRYRNRNVFVI